MTAALQSVSELALVDRARGGGVGTCVESFDTTAHVNVETVRSFKAPSDGENLSPAPGGRNAQMCALGKFTKSSAVEEVAAVEDAR